MPDISFDPLVPRQAAGGVLINAEGKVLLREPKNHYGGYIWTFPKGGVDDGETHPQAALREVREEVGWVGHIVGRLAVLGGDTSETTYYLMRPVRQAGRFDNETQAIEWVDRTEAERRISMTLTSKGKIRDLTVLRLAYEAHLRMTGGKMSAEECIVESATYVDIHQRKFTEDELQWIHAHVKSPTYDISFADWKARHYALSEAYGIEATKSGFDDGGEPTAADIAKVDAVLADDKLPATAEAGKAYVVHWAGGRGIFACKRKAYLRPWLDEQGEWAEIISIKYKTPEHGGKPLKVVEAAQPEDHMDIDIPAELVEDEALLPPAQVVNEDSFTDALIHGKAVLIKNVWWQIAGRDLKSDKVALVVSKYAKADGYKDQKPKTMRLSALVQKIKSGKWGANINGKRYGPEQDAKKRDTVRKAAGLSAAPGAGKFRKDESEDILALYNDVSARANAIHDQIPKTTDPAAKRALWNKRDALADEANALFKKLSQCQKDAVVKAEHDRLAKRMVGIFKRGMTETLDDEIVDGSELVERLTVPAGNGVLRFLARHVQAEDHEDAANMEIDNDRRRLSDNVSIFWAKATAAWDDLSLPEQHEAFNAIDAGTYRALVHAPPRGVRAREIFRTFDDVTVTAFNEAVMKQSKAMQAREARLRARGFTYRANQDAPPPKKGYPPMVRRWAKDEGFPLPTMQRMWDIAVEEVDSSGDLDRPDPGQRNPRAIEFWKETTRLFRSMVAARKSLEA